MRRNVLILVVVGAVLLLTGVAGVRLLVQVGPRGTLAGLGRDEAAYQRARQEILYNTTDPLPLLLAYIRNPRNSATGRARALRTLLELSRQQDLAGADSVVIPLLAEQSPGLRVEALKAVGGLATPAAIDAVSAAFLQAPDSVTFVSAFEALRSIGQALADSASDAIIAGDTSALATYARAAERMAAGRGSIYLRLRAHYLSRGDSARSGLYRRKSGTLDRWWVCGPFDNSSMGGFTKPYPPETRPFSRADSFAVQDDMSSGWFPVERTDETGRIVLNNLFARRCCSLAYLFTYLHSDSTQDAYLLLGAGDGCRAWLNDSLVMSRINYRASDIDQTIVRVHLRKGLNTLLVKGAQGAGDWSLLPRLTRLDGDGFEGVRPSLYPDSRPSSHPLAGSGRTTSR